MKRIFISISTCSPTHEVKGVPRKVWGVQTPPPEVPKAIQNRANLNLIVNTVKDRWI